jgi:hypothetical protein
MAAIGSKKIKKRKKNGLKKGSLTRVKKDHPPSDLPV